MALSITTVTAIVKRVFLQSYAVDGAVTGVGAVGETEHCGWDSKGSSDCGLGIGATVISGSVFGPYSQPWLQ